ncbi:MAG: tripartite tricarboxylate transporter substrate binding protein [Hyphomicrobiales bacterium]|nr:tripartite tricarboxylate transporter substrate binding protein [Hyphomicrobiales bacterium]
MRRFIHLCRLTVAATTLVVAYTNVAGAQDYPQRPIRIISPVPAGGLSDVAMRPMTMELQARLGQPVIIDNRAGASGMLAGRACAQAAPDGYTICNLFNDVALNAPFLFKSVGYDPRKDFVPITNVYYITGGFLVTPALNVSTLPELIARSKASPGGLNLGVPATTTEMFIKSFNAVTGANFQTIPYKSGNEVANALLTSSVAVGNLGIGNLVPQIEAGKFKVVAVDSLRRSPLLPAVTTLQELGLAHTRIKPWYGFFAPAGTPAAIIDKLREEIVAIYREPRMHERVLIGAGLEPILDTPAEFGRFIAAEWDRTAAQMRALNVAPQ